MNVDIDLTPEKVPDNAVGKTGPDPAHGIALEGEGQNDRSVAGPRCVEMGSGPSRVQLCIGEAIGERFHIGAQHRPDRSRP